MRYGDIKIYFKSAPEAKYALNKCENKKHIFDKHNYGPMEIKHRRLCHTQRVKHKDKRDIEEKQHEVENSYYQDRIRGHKKENM